MYIPFTVYIAYSVVCELSPCGRRTSTSHSAWSLKRSKKCKNKAPLPDKAGTQTSKANKKQQGRVIITCYTLEKRETSVCVVC